MREQKWQGADEVMREWRCKGRGVLKRVHGASNGLMEERVGEAVADIDFEARAVVGVPNRFSHHMNSTFHFSVLTRSARYNISRSVLLIHRSFWRRGSHVCTGRGTRELTSYNSLLFICICSAEWHIQTRGRRLSRLPAKE